MATLANPTRNPYIEGKTGEPHSSEFVERSADTARKLLDEFKQKLLAANRPIDREPYQIKLFWDSGIMRLRYDALVWFDHILTLHEDTIGDRADIGSEYVSACVIQKHERDVRRRAINSRDRYSTAEIKEHTCSKRSCSCRKTHMPENCKMVIGCINGSSTPCKQFFDEASYIDMIWIERTQFILHSRPESTRDILLFPVNHSENESFVSAISTWQAIITVEQRLLDVLSRIRRSAYTESPIESVYFNYGSWTTAMTKNKLAKTAHAHVHLLLTSTAISVLSSEKPRTTMVPREKLYILNLSGCYRDPVDYEFSDAITLMNSRLLYYHIGETEKNIGIIKSDIKKMQNDLDSLRENIITKDSMKMLMEEMFLKFSLHFKNGQPSLVNGSSDSDPSSISTITWTDEESKPLLKRAVDVILSPTILPSATSTTVPLKQSRGQKKKAKQRAKQVEKASPVHMSKI